MASVRSLNLTKSGERLLKRRLTRNSASTSKLNSNKTNSVSVTTLNRKKSGRASSKKRSTRTTNIFLRKNSTSSLNEQDLNTLTNEFASTSITELPLIQSARKLSIKTVETIPDETIETPTVEQIIPAEIVEEEILNESKIEENLPQFTVENLEPIKTIGTGTFGRVQLVFHRSTNQYYALKTMFIKNIVDHKQVEHVRQEKKVLSRVDHPFLVRLEWTSHTDRKLYLLMEYLPGGELFRQMRKFEKFDSKTASFYASEVLLALDYLHHRDILYRDLKPENIILDVEGHIRLVDFGFAKETRERTFTTCGTVEYLAPEVIQNRGHHKASDWWGLGILIFEMLAGFTPFFDNDQMTAYKKIVAGKIDFPRHFDFASKQIVRKLLNTDQSQRLGSAKNGGDEIKREAWFVALSWDDVLAKRVEPPIKPTISSPGDTNNFEKYDDIDEQSIPIPSKFDVQLFKDF